MVAHGGAPEAGSFVGGGGGAHPWKRRVVLPQRDPVGNDNLDRWDPAGGTVTASGEAGEASGQRK